MKTFQDFYPYSELQWIMYYKDIFNLKVNLSFKTTLVEF